MRGGVTCDTSVLVAALMPWHQAHDLSREVVDQEVTTIIAHVLAETFSSTTRLPEPFRATPGSVLSALRRLARPVVALSADLVLPTWTVSLRPARAEAQPTTP